MRPGHPTAPAVELRGLSKRFGSVQANAEVNLRAEAGTIHGLIGENGAGKSTAMKMLFGMFRPDAGEIYVHGHPCRWESPADAIASGIGMVHQHFMLAGPISALDNLLLAGGGGAAPPGGWAARLGARLGGLGVLDRRGGRARLDSLSRQYGLSVDFERPIEELPVGKQQTIEILKLLYREANILILDEPTAVLTPQQASQLFENLKKLRDEGKTILFVTHKLKEVMAFTDRVSVFRNGHVTGTVETCQTNPQELADLMVGRKVVLRVEVPPAAALGAAALELDHLHLVGAAHDSRPRLAQVGFSVRCGEIVGLAGVEGNGQSELLQAILHPCDPLCRTSGHIKVLGQDVTRWEARRIRELGVAVIPEDRQHEGLLLEEPVRENFLLGLHRDHSFQRNGFLNSKRIDQAAARALEDYDVRPRDLALCAGNLSGGNQQKLIVAREFQRRPRLLIAAQPTRGVDVGAIEFIHHRIIQARTERAGVLLVSSELDEVLALSDRILVMYEGQVVAEFARGHVSEKELGLKMGGA